MKAEIIRRVKEEGISVAQAAKDAGAHKRTIYGWLGSGATSAPSWGKFSRLQKQNKELSNMYVALCRLFFISPSPAQ